MNIETFFNNLRIGPRLFVGFGAIIGLLVLVSGLALHEMRTLAGLTADLYEHPFTVSVTTREIQTHLERIRIGMKDVALAQDQASVEDAAQRVHAAEQEIERLFQLVKQQFLGDQKDVDAALQLFTQAKAVRSGIFADAQAGNYDKAKQDVNTGEGDRRYKLLTTAIQVVTDFTGKKALAFMQNAQFRAEQAYLYTLLMLAVTICLGVAVAIALARTITRPLRAAVAVAAQVSQGDLNVQFAAPSNDEVGQMAAALQRMVNYIQDVAAVAEKISKQDLQVEITPKSGRDVLNHSLQRMVTTLQTMIAELNRALAAMAQETWLKDGLNQLNNALLGETSLQETCRNAVSFAARYVEAGHGVLYTYDAEQHVLKLGGSFAFTERDQLAPQFRLGEGVIGQVAQDRKPILLKNLRRTEQLINTGTVSEPPLNTYTFPLLYNEQLHGVLELASFTPYNERQQAFLNEANRVIATVIFSARQRERAQELLLLSQYATQEAEIAVKEAQQAKAEAEEQAAAVQQANAQLEEQQQELLQQQEEMQQINAHLEEQQQRVQQQSEELRQQNESLKTARADLDRRTRELESAGRDKLELLSRMSHDIRTPLNSMILVSKMLSKNEQHTFDERDVKQLEVIQQAGEDVFRLLNQVLGTGQSENESPLEGGRGVFFPETPLPMAGPTSAPPAETLKHVLIVEDNAAQREAIRDVLEQLPGIQTTGVASPQEAIREIDKGGYAAAILDLGLQEGSGYDVCNYIKDHALPLPVIIYTGRDLTEEEERRLRLYTDSIILKSARSYERLLDEVSLCVQKTPPALTPAPIGRPGGATPPALTVDFAGQKILIADDDVKNVFVLASALEKHNAVVLDAQNGEDALALLRREKDVACVLMDVMMPGMDGYAAMREIRKDPQLKQLPVIALTAKALKEDRQKCLQAGANDYLSKPVDYETLIRLVNTWMQK